MDKQAGIWDRLKQLWRKWRGKGEVDPTRAEDHVVEELAAGMAKAVGNQAKPFIRAVVEMSNKHGLPTPYLQYVFWLIAEQRRAWPRMRSGYANALTLGKTIVMNEGLMPNYRDGLDPPPPEHEGAVDTVLEWVAFWVLTTMKANLVETYLAELKRLTPKMQKALGDRLPPDKAMPYLKELFETELHQQPSQFADGPLLDQVFHQLIN